MWRNFLTLIVGFAVVLVQVNPPLSAQEQYPANQADPYPEDGDYPSDNCNRYCASETGVSQNAWNAARDQFCRA